MSAKNRTQRRERGFSLLEMLIVVLIIGVVAGAVLSQLNIAIQRSSAEQTKLDDMQEARDFVDQFFRDINEIGYPNSRMVDTTSVSWSPALVTQATYGWASQYINDNRFAIGLVKIDANELRFEADTNGDGNVQSVVYMINGSTTCTLCLQRSQVAKVTANPLNGQTTNWGTEVNDVVNTNPIFTYYKADGTQVTGLPIDISTAAGAATIASVKTIQISLTIRNNVIKDLQSGLPLETDFQGEVSLNNCSMAASGAPMSCQ
jgi:prepilin-type N-terminal cleavage/methylation domain-containing protein